MHREGFLFIWLYTGNSPDVDKNWSSSQCEVSLLKWWREGMGTGSKEKERARTKRKWAGGWKGTATARTEEEEGWEGEQMGKCKGMCLVERALPARVTSYEKPSFCFSALRIKQHWGYAEWEERRMGWRGSHYNSQTDDFRKQWLGFFYSLHIVKDPGCVAHGFPI